MNPSTATPAGTSLPQTLEGFRVGVTSDRRSEELIAAFRRRGAEVMHAPALRISPQTESVTLERDTRRILQARPDFTLITTAYGMRRWVEAADTYGLGTALREVLGGSTILVRGPKARGAVRAADLEDAGSAVDERTSTVIDMLLRHDLDGRTVAFQLHGMSSREEIRRLEDAGAQVLTVMPYTWARPAEDSALREMIDAAIAGQLDLITFTSAPAGEAFIHAAHQYGRFDALIAALNREVTAVAVGDVTASPLLDAGVRPLVPARWRLGAMIRAAFQHLEEDRTLRLTGHLGLLELRGRTLWMPEVHAQTVPLAPGPAALMRALMCAEGSLVSRAQLLDALGSCESERALEMSVSRLRAALPVDGLVTTVVKRGYRLNL